MYETELNGEVCEHLQAGGRERRRGPVRVIQAEAVLPPVLQDAIDLIFRQLDCERATYRSYTGFVFAVLKPDFPSPTAAIRQLNDGVFYPSVFHRIGSAPERGGTYGKMIAQYVHLCT
jgi:hypothetical protein